MFCRRCGKELPDNARYCTACGADNGAVAVVTRQQQDEANSVLIWGIVGLAFSCSFFLSFLGIIFSVKARNLAEAYLARYGVVYGKAKVGRIFSKIGVPVGIAMTALCVLYILLIAVLVSIGVMSYY